jgi:hypothetical protein
MKNEVKTITTSIEHIAACCLYCEAYRKYHSKDLIKDLPNYHPHKE